MPILLEVFDGTTHSESFILSQLDSWTMARFADSECDKLGASKEKSCNDFHGTLFETAQLMFESTPSTNGFSFKEGQVTYYFSHLTQGKRVKYTDDYFIFNLTANAPF